MSRSTTVVAALTCGALGLSSLALAGCGDDASQAAPTTEPSAEATSPTTAATSAITAPEADRVDLETPTFSNPTQITNAYFPTSALDQVVLLGEDEGLPLRAEVTLLPDNKTVGWNGQEVETRTVQFIAYLDDEIIEVATDFFAQDDAGNVWYFGEDVTNYEGGEIKDHDGTWLAGKDGPPGMIMPADPTVGQVFRPENIPDLVFEEVTVQETDLTAEGPTGPLTGVLGFQEMLADGDTELKQYAPGYGEYHTQHGAEVLTVALGLPIDATANPYPESLDQLDSAAEDLFDRMLVADWSEAGSVVDDARGAWNVYQEDANPPALLTSDVDSTLASFDAAEEHLDLDAALAAASDLLQGSLDLASLHPGGVPTDISRIDRWARQLQADASDPARARADAVTIGLIWDRIGHAVEDQADAGAVTDAIASTEAAVAGGDESAILGAAADLREVIDAVESGFPS